MKTQKILIIFLFLVSQIIISQNNDKDIDIIGFACYGAGDSTEKIYYFEKLIKERKLDSLSFHLDSKNSAERYLSTIIMERMDSIGKIKLNKRQRLSIRQNYSSKNKVSICDGCSSDADIELKLLLKPNEIIKAYHMFFFRKQRTWLKQHI